MGFVWTDELVKEFILKECNKQNTWSADGVDLYMDNFKESKQDKTFCVKLSVGDFLKLKRFIGGLPKIDPVLYPDGPHFSK